MVRLRQVDPGQEVSVRVPATSANLGPGYDSLGLALDFHDKLRVRTATEGLTRIEVAGEGQQDLPRDETHLCVRIMAQFLEAAGFAAPPLELYAENRIPHGRGLGSSAAAVVSAAAAANALLPEGDRLDRQALLEFCVDLEGHPDNVAPALCGSLAISWRQGTSCFTASAAVHPDVSVVAAIPSRKLSTAAARSLLPDLVPHVEAAENAGRAALLIHALSSEPELLLPATEDFLHQPYRIAAMPESAELVRGLRSAGMAAVISGAGPTVAVFARGDDEVQQIETQIRGRVTGGGVSASRDAETLDSWRVLRLKVDVEGARVEVHRR